jgi:hypothetical protein
LWDKGACKTIENPCTLSHLRREFSPYPRAVNSPVSKSPRGYTIEQVLTWNLAANTATKYYLVLASRLKITLPRIESPLSRHPSRYFPFPHAGKVLWSPEENLLHPPCRKIVLVCGRDGVTDVTRGT